MIKLLLCILCEKHLRFSIGNGQTREAAVVSAHYRSLCDSDGVCGSGVSHRHLSDHLSELVENTLSDLEHSKVRRLFINWFHKVNS